ncbi:MAG: signal peptidase I [Elusimicrobia bacterium]|nr:signal peptidase I [Elusimicrobiota bacterium]
MSIQTRTRSSIVAGSLTTSELYPSLVVAAFAAIAGFWKSYRTAKRPGKKGYYLAEDAEWSETVFSAVMLAAVLMYFVIQAFKIPSGSMERTLLIGDHLFVNKFIYGFRVPLTGKRVLPLSKVDRGDIVVFQFPVDDPSEVHCGDLQYKKDFIKRVVGLPGETVQVVGGRVLINGKELAPEPYAQYTAMDRQAPSVKTLGLSAMQYQDLWQSHQLDKELQDIQKDYFGPVIVPEGGYFVMGDNRDHSCDSRYWGPVESKYLKGKAWIIYWPPSRMGLVR